MILILVEQGFKKKTQIFLQVCPVGATSVARFSPKPGKMPIEKAFD
jgi:hypothetical protein